MSESIQAADPRSPRKQNLKADFDSGDPAFIANPVPYYHALLADGPYRLDIGAPSTVVARYADCVAVIRDHQRFSSVVRPLPGADRWIFFGDLQLMPFTDPPMHTRLRRLGAPMFAPRKIEAIAPRVAAMVDRLLDQWEGRAEIDFVPEFANQLPSLVMGYLLDVPEQEFGLLKEVIGYLAELDKIDPDAYARRLAVQEAYFKEMIEKRRRNPSTDIIGTILSGYQEKGANEKEVEDLVSTLALAGISTTADMLSGIVYNLLLHPDQIDLLRREPALAAGAVEEALRYDGPIHTTIRFALADCEIAGVNIPAGMPVYAVIGAANRDPAVFKSPVAFDIRRDPNDHLTFGDGIHFCIGAPPARLAGKIAVSRIFERFPRLRLADPKAPPKYKGNVMSRGLSRLPLRID